MSTSNRRNFLKTLGLGSGALALPFLAQSENQTSTVYETAGQRFNMCGYAAPKISTVRGGFIGLGMEGPGAV